MSGLHLPVLGMRFLPDIRQVAPHKCESSILSRQLAPTYRGTATDLPEMVDTPILQLIWETNAILRYPGSRFNRHPTLCNLVRSFNPNLASIQPYSQVHLLCYVPTSTQHIDNSIFCKAAERAAISSTSSLRKGMITWLHILIYSHL